MKNITIIMLILISTLVSCKKEHSKINACSNINCEITSEKLNDSFGFFSMIWWDISNPTINGTGQSIPNIAGEMVPNGQNINHLSNGDLKPNVIYFLNKKAQTRDSIIQVLDNCCGGHETYWYEWYDDYMW